MSQFNTASTSTWSPLQLLATQGFLAGFALALLFSVANTRFLLDYGPEWLPTMYVVVACIMFGLSFTYNYYSRRVSSGRLVRVAYGLTAAVYLISLLAILDSSIRWISFVLLVAFNVLYIYQLMMITIQATKLFDLRQMKSTYPLVLASQTAAVIVGGVSVTLLTNLLSEVSNLLWICALFSLLTWGVVWLTTKTFAAEFDRLPTSTQEHPQGQATLREALADPYARNIFIYRFLSGWGTEMVILLFTIQASRQFQAADDLASFFGGFMASGTFLTLLFLLLAAGPLLKRFGLRFGIMLNPIVATVPVLALVIIALTNLPVPLVVFGLVLITRVSDFILYVSTTEPSLKAMYQALPEDKRATLITIVEGLTLPLIYGIVGSSLILFDAFGINSDLFMYSYLAVICVAWTWYGWQTYQLYTTTLLTKLSQRTFDQVELTIEDATTAKIVTTIARSSNPFRAHVALDLLAQTEHPEYDGLLLELLYSPQVAIQQDALARLETRPSLTRSLSFDTFMTADQPAELHAAALQAYLASGQPAAVEHALNNLNSPDTDLQRGALVGLLRYGGLAGSVQAGERLLALSHSSAEADHLLLAETLAALGEHNFYQPLIQLLQSPSWDVRRAALKAAVHGRHPSMLPLLIEQLRFPQTRSHALEALAAYGAAVGPFIAAALEQTPREDAPNPLPLIRLAAGLPPETAQSYLLPHLQHPQLPLRYTVLTTLKRTGYRVLTSAARSELDQALAQETQRATEWLAAYAALQTAVEEDDSTPFTQLRAALNDDYQRTLQRLLLLISFAYDPKLVAGVADFLASDDRGEQAQAIETADLVLAQPHKQLILPLIDNELTAAQRIATLSKHPQINAPTATTAAEWLTLIINNYEDAFDDWTQACAIYEAGQSETAAWRSLVHKMVPPKRPLTQETAHWVAQNTPSSGELPMLTIEKVSYLKATNIFQPVASSVLAAVAQIVDVLELPVDETFIREGEIGRELYLIIEGSVLVLKNNKPIIELKVGDTVGELAIFDPEPRSADVVTLEPTILFRLDRATLQEVMADRPEISNGIIQALSRRIREQGRLMSI